MKTVIGVLFAGIFLAVIWHLVTQIPFVRPFFQHGGRAAWSVLSGAAMSLARLVGLGNSGARFLGFFQKSWLLNRFHQGLLVDGRHDRLSLEDSFRHVAIVAPTGAGKTTRYVIPNLLTLEDGSMVVTDPSGEVYQKISGLLAHEGFQIRPINLAVPTRSLGYNPLSRLRTPLEVSETAHILVKSANPDYGQDAFWYQGAETAIDIMIQILQSIGDPRYLNLHNVLHLLQNFGSDGSALDDLVCRRASAATYSQFKAFISGNDRTIQSFITTAITSLKMINSPEIAAIMAQDDIDFAELRRTPTVVFLIVPADKIEFFGFFLNLFYTQFFSACMRQLPQPGELPIHVLYDEFGHSSIPNFETIATTIRKYRVSLSLILQSVSQLKERYGQNGAATILEGGVNAKLFYPGLDTETAKMVEAMLGRANQNARERNLMNADRIRTMKLNRALFFFGNQEPALLRTAPYFQQGRFRDATRFPPHAIAAPAPASRLSFMSL